MVAFPELSHYLEHGQTHIPHGQTYPGFGWCMCRYRVLVSSAVQPFNLILAALALMVATIPPSDFMTMAVMLVRHRYHHCRHHLCLGIPAREALGRG